MQPLLTIEEAADLLRIKVRSLYELTSRRRRERSEHPIPVIKLNSKCLRFRREDLEKWVEAQVSHE
jgi:excisionase family DNA binding protein